MMRAWILPILLVASGLLAAGALVGKGSPGSRRCPPAPARPAGGAELPLAFPRSVGAAEAQRRSAADGRPVVYWRPGCAYCLRLRIRLGRGAHRLHWVDIWRDPAGADAVRAFNGGDETVPTVVVAGRPHVNPDVEWVRTQAAARPRD